MARAGNVRFRIGAAVVALLTAGSLAGPVTAARASQPGGRALGSGSVAAAASSAVSASTGSGVAAGQAAPQSRSGTLAGTVFAPAGASQPGGTAVCVRATLLSGSQAVASQRQAARAATPLTAAPGRARSTASAITAGDGQFQLPGLAAGLYRLTYRLCSRGGLPMAAGALAAPRQSRLALVTAGRTRLLPSATLRQPEAAIVAEHTAAWLRGHFASASGAAAGPASSKGHITGTVAAPSGRGLRGICVFIFSRKRGIQTHTGPAGGYLSTLAPGRYRVAFESGCGDHGNWLLQFYKNTPNQAKARTIVVKSGKTTRHIGAIMHAGGEIRGTVTNTAGKPVNGICVAPIEARADGFFAFGEKNGRYDVHGLEPGNYTMQFSAGCGSTGNFAPQAWKNKSPGQQPTVLHVTHGRVFRHIDAVMAPGAEVSGKVTLSTTGAPLAGVCVAVFGGGALSGVQSFTRTRADGTYLAKSLSTGKYRLDFEPGCPNNADFLGARLPVSVQLSNGTNTGGVNIALSPGGKVTGMVTSKSGQPLPGICVFVEGRDGFGQVHTSASGHYTVGRLASGKYEVDFSTGCGSTGSFAPQSFDNEANSAGADLVPVTAGQTSSGINAVMQPGATITGRVTDSAGHPVSGVCVAASPGNELLIPMFGRVKNGRYRLGSLPPGQSSIFFEDCGTTKLAAQGYGAPPGMSDGPLVQLPAGRVTGHLNGVMIASGNISGTVRTTAGRPLGDICATAFGRHTGAITQAMTNRHGRYTITDSPPDTYRVQFFNCFLGNVAPSWYRNEPGPRSATPVVVRARATRRGIDARLAKGGSVSGVVTDQATGKPVSNACIDIFSTDFSPLNINDQFAITGSKGRYTARNLASGSYFAEFFPCGSQPNLTSEFRRVHITAGRHTPAVSAALRPGGSVSGVVLGGNPATSQPGICVDLDPLSPTVIGGSAISAHAGAFTAVGLAPGQYRVHFGDTGCSGGLVPQWYLHQASFATATTITVQAGATTKLQPDTLATDGQIAGTVTGPGHAALSGVCVTVARVPARAQQPARAVSRAGTYAISSLLPGRYRVQFSAGCGATGLATQWWQHASSAAKSTLVRVRPNTVTSGISATLRRN